MQKPKTGKISIFSSLDVKLGFLAGRVGLIQFPVGSDRVGLKMWATRPNLGSGPKCQPETRPDDQSRNEHKYWWELKWNVRIIEELELHIRVMWYEKINLYHKLMNE